MRLCAPCSVIILRDTRASSIYTSNNADDDDDDPNFFLYNARRRCSNSRFTSSLLWCVYKDTTRSSTSRRIRHLLSPPPLKGSRAWGWVEDPTTTEAGSAGPATAPLDPEIRLRRGSYFHGHKLPFCRPPPRHTRHPNLAVNALGEPSAVRQQNPPPI